MECIALEPPTENNIFGFVSESHLLNMEVARNQNPATQATQVRCMCVCVCLSADV